MEYKRAGDVYSFECGAFKVSIVGEVEKINFDINGGGKENVDAAFHELKRLKEIRAANEVAKVKHVNNFHVTVTRDTDDALRKIEELNLAINGVK